MKQKQIQTKSTQNGGWQQIVYECNKQLAVQIERQNQYQKQIKQKLTKQHLCVCIGLHC